MTTAPPRSDPRPVRAVVFDLDGTLIDTEWVFVEAARRLLAGRGIPFDADFMASILGTPASNSLPLFIQRFGLPETMEAVAAEYKRFFLETLDADHAPLMPGAHELLDRLDERGLPKAIATSSGREYVHHMFGPHGLLDRFAFVLTADEVKHGKPHPEIFLTAAARFGLAPAEVLVIEDSIHGIRAAKAAGARVVLVPHAHTPEHDRAEADAVVASLAAPELWGLIG